MTTEHAEVNKETDVVRRDASVDILKGVAIIAVVFGHVYRGMWSAGLGSSELLPGKQIIDNSVYFWHLVIFAFLSGIFVSRGIAREGTKKYFKSRATLFLWLYIVWQIIQVGIKFFASANVNTKVSLVDAFAFWKPEGQLWFFPWIIIALAVSILLGVWRRSRLSWLGLLLLALLSVASWGYDGGYVGTQGLSLIFFYALGIYLGYERFSALLMSVSVWVHGFIAFIGLSLYVVGLFTLPAITPTVQSAHPRSFMIIASGILMTSLSSVSLISLGYLLSKISVGKIFAFIGRYSLEIFIAHIVFVSIVRMVMTKCGVFSIPIYLVAGVVIGVILPILLGKFVSRCGIPLFSIPRFSKGAS